MPKVEKQLLTTSQIMEAVDKDAIASAILSFEEGEKPFDDFDFEDAKLLVWTAAEKWLARDLSEFTLEAVENKLVTDYAGPEYPFKCFLDVCGMIKPDGMKPFDKFARQKYVIDWKTSKNTLGTEWKQRLLDSHQWQMYSDVYGASLFIYRGLSRVRAQTQEVLIPVPDTNHEEVLHQLRAIGCQINALRAEKFVVFPRNKPHGCEAYGKVCPYYDSCMDYSMPKGELPLDKALSYSFMNNFMLCNERARREVLAEGMDYQDETNFGRAVHRGLASLWSQAFRLFGTYES